MEYIHGAGHVIQLAAGTGLSMQRAIVSGPQAVKERGLTGEVELCMMQLQETSANPIGRSGAGATLRDILN